jgi:hypothetical protein
LSGLRAAFRNYAAWIVASWRSAIPGGLIDRSLIATTRSVLARLVLQPTIRVRNPIGYPNDSMADRSSMRIDMKKYHRGLMAATLALSSYAAIPAHAEVLNIPGSAAIYSGYPGNDCGSDPGVGIFSWTICDFEIPLTIPAGHTIQQISVVHGTANLYPNPEIEAQLLHVDFVPGGYVWQFPWSSVDHVPDGEFQVSRLMAQTKFGGYPDAFLVQPNTIYKVVLHIESGALATGLQVTYQ